MNFREPPGVSVVLMSRRPGAPYVDQLSEDGAELIYEGHDVMRYRGSDVEPKKVDQPWELPSGAPTDNAKFARASEAATKPRVRVYEKLRDGIWSDRGLFTLVGYDYTQSELRRVFKFRMRLTDEPPSGEHVNARPIPTRFRRQIPSHVKQEVFKRDKGRCVVCGARDQLHFDHDLPFAHGGSGLTAANVRVLCARHNLKKGARIE
jgi:hypothetical protein